MNNEKHPEKTLDKDATVKERLNLHYEILSIDLSIARTMKDEEVHPYKVEWYNELKVLYAPSAFDIRLNKKDNDVIPIRAGDLTTILNFKFNQVYIQNDEGAGVAIIWLASRWD